MEKREGYKKGWRPDLMYPNMNVHVKACTRYSSLMFGKGGSTWTFQYGNTSGTGGKDPLFYTNFGNEIIALVELVDIYSYRMAFTSPAKFLIPFMRDPVKQSYVTLKKCLYETDLNQHAISFCFDSNIIHGIAKSS